MAASPWWESWIPLLQPYAILLRLFVDGIVEAPEFEVLFLRLYKSDQADWPEYIFSILDALFADVDKYCADAALRAAVNGIDAGELRARAVRALADLKTMAG